MLLVLDDKLKQTPQGIFLAALGEQAYELELEGVHTIQVAKTLHVKGINTPAILNAPIPEDIDTAQSLGGFTSIYNAVLMIAEKRENHPTHGMGQHLIWRKALIEHFAYNNSCMVADGQTFDLTVAPGQLFDRFSWAQGLDVSWIAIGGENTCDC